VVKKSNLPELLGAALGKERRLSGSASDTVPRPTLGPNIWTTYEKKRKESLGTAKMHPSYRWIRAQDGRKEGGTVGGNLSRLLRDTGSKRELLSRRPKGNEKVSYRPPRNRPLNGRGKRPIISAAKGRTSEGRKPQFVKNGEKD